MNTSLNIFRVYPYLVVDPPSGKVLDTQIKIFKTDPLPSKNCLPSYGCNFVKNYLSN